MLPTYSTLDGLTPGQYRMGIAAGPTNYLTETPPPMAAISTGTGNMPPALPPSFGGSTGGTQTNPGSISAPATGTAAPTPTTTPATTPASAYDAFNAFKDSAGYQFALDQAMNALNNKYAASGQLQSGAAAKGIADYVQNMALQNYFFPYMNLLSGQQAVGAGAASSIAGVGTNFGDTAANINGQMGGVIQNGANNASNAALVNGYNNAGMWNNIGSALGNLGSSIMAPSPSAVPATGAINVTPHYGSYY